MSSADPTRPSGAPPRPRRLVVVLAVVLPLLLLLAVATPLGVGWLRSRPAAPTPATQGGPGVGDPYYPDSGSSGYDALAYTISVGWDPGEQTLRGTTLISARATQTLSSLYYDLALTTDQVEVNGRPAAFERSGFSDVRVTPASPVTAGAEFRVAVTYSGQPGQVKRGDLTAWTATGQEWTVAGEPESSAWWFPADDHPSDPALMDVSVRVPAGLQAISVGVLASEDTGDEAGFDTWHWVSAEPVATYLNFLSIGHYALDRGVADGRPYVYAVSEQLSPADRSKAMATLERSGAIVRTLETMFGPYPFSALGGLVPAADLPFDGLETQTRPVYERGAILGGSATGLLAHELAHMWFGDNVTLRQWNDIFDNEAWASWAAWGYAERTGGRSAAAAFSDTYDRLKDQPAFWRITMTDPGRRHLFDAVYLRGPMALQALRTVLGDRAFFAMARKWAQDRGTRSLEDWMAAVQRQTTVDLTPFFQAWLADPTAPQPSAANGFRR